MSFSLQKSDHHFSLVNDNHQSHFSLCPELAGPTPHYLPPIPLPDLTPSEETSHTFKHHSGVGIIPKVAKEIAKSEGVKVAKMFKTVTVAGKIVYVAHEYAENVEEARRANHGPVQTHVCAAARTAMEIGVAAHMTGMAARGVPPFLALAVECPPVALAVPIVGALIPEAAKNMHTYAQAAGHEAEDLCNKAFDVFSKGY